MVVVVVVVVVLFVWGEVWFWLTRVVLDKVPGAVKWL